MKPLVLLLPVLLALSACHAQPGVGRAGGGCTAAEVSKPELRVGAEVLMDSVESRIGSARVAVVANHTSIVGGTHLVDTLQSHGVRIIKIFCPEHGFRGTAAAGAHVSDGTDPETGLPVISLYGKNKNPTPEQLRGVDMVLFDLQDVGCRFYTYLSTLHYVMEASAEQGIPLVVLDRPNPNGHYIDGPVLDTQACRSFVGLHPVPVVYGMTIGEYAQMINGEHWAREECNLSVVPMEGYRRDSVGYRLPVPPSPNLRNPHAIALYPSVCFFEGTRVSVGRGTDWPFEVFTYQADTLDLRQYALPTEGRLDLRPLLDMYRRLPHGQFFLPTRFFDLLAGTPRLRQQIERGMDEADIRASWQPALQQFLSVRARYLIY